MALLNPKKFSPLTVYIQLPIADAPLIGSMNRYAVLGTDVTDGVTVRVGVWVLVTVGVLVIDGVIDIVGVIDGVMLGVVVCVGV